MAQERSTPRRRASRRAALAVLPLALGVTVALAGCGGSDNSASSTTTTTTTGQTTTSGTPTTLQLAADPTGKLAYDKTELEAPAGEVTIELTNESAVSHDVAIEGNGVDETSSMVANGETTSVTADLQPGTYTFYCTVPGHEDAGMKGTLTVK